jgi:hypothetical protein
MILSLVITLLNLPAIILDLMLLKPIHISHELVVQDA